MGAVSPSVGTGVSLVFGNQNWSTRAEGVGTAYPRIRNRGVATGDWFSDADVTSASRVAIIGQTVANNLFGGADPIGQTIRVAQSAVPRDRSAGGEGAEQFRAGPGRHAC